ncbi:small multi-drug export protein [Thioalkalivibrio sulfidiphilus]|uniref:small multi-drug export protein n=1 Tax=Thioalkalivibrio sulfidiphilus TaxID=1033854 RepID=UPI003B3060D2
MTRQGLPLRLLASTEGRLLYLGVVLSLALLAALLTAWALSLDDAHVYAVMTGLNLVIGRAAGMSFGYASGLGHAQVVPLNMLVESIHVLVVYPLFALSWRQLVRLHALKPYFARMHQTATSRSGAVRRYGIAGLFLFVFMPFWMTGPVVGAIIGFLIGLRPWVNVTVVLLSTYIAIGIWALLLNELSAWAETISRFAPYALVLAIVLIALVMQLLYRRRARHKP